LKHAANAGEAVSDFDSYSRKILSFSAALAAISAAAILITTYHISPDIFAGFCLGSVFSLLRWRLVIGELRKFAGSAGTGRWVRMFFFRYGLTSAVIAISVASPSFSVVTAVAGIFLVNAVIMGEQVITVFRAGIKGHESWE
jgi:hypothetical protein